MATKSLNRSMDKLTVAPSHINPAQLRHRHSNDANAPNNPPHGNRGAHTLASEGPCIREHYDVSARKVVATVVRVRVYAGEAEQSVLLKFPPGEPVLAAHVTDAVSRKVGLGNSLARKIFSLWMVGKDLEIQIRPKLDLFQVKQKWPRWMVKYTHFPEAEDPEHPINDASLVFRRNATIPKSVDRKIADDAVLRLLYGEAKENVIAGRYPCTTSDAVTLAGIRMQIIYGDHDGRKHGPGFITSAGSLQNMIPSPLLPRMQPEEWESLILKEHQKYNGKSAMIARMLYLQYVRQWSCYGSAWFPACREVPPGGFFEFRTQKWLLGLNAEGFVAVDQNKYKVAFAQPWEQVEWTFSPDTFIVDYRHDRQKLQLTVITPQAAMIDNLATRQAYLVDKQAQDLEVRRVAASKSQDLNASMMGSGLVAVGFAAKAESLDSQLNVSQTHPHQSPSEKTQQQPSSSFKTSPSSMLLLKSNNELLAYMNAYKDAKQEYKSRAGSGNKNVHGHSGNNDSQKELSLQSSSPHTPDNLRHNNVQPSPVELHKDQKVAQDAQDAIDTLFAKSMISPW
ncbi:hypothetical protein SeMB42_g04568 [Synchytrium endobioticum]|uniref:FERM domain-containing protein n=1 Tax=Synchytrium endobioticum TaxID=286115 RepID=A0A507CX77_9FUNG|nr:hypothetical protein SeMB42_g04568 [Synchytrium endobioticum]